MVVDQKIDLRRLILYSDLYEFYTHFKRILEVSVMDSNGFLTLSAASAYLPDVEINMAASHFWESAAYMLGKLNEDVIRKRKMREGRK